MGRFGFRNDPMPSHKRQDNVSVAPDCIAIPGGEIAFKDRLAYNKAELCSLLGISATSVWRLEARGLLRPLPHLRHKIYPRSEVERFLKSGGNR